MQLKKECQWVLVTGYDEEGTLYGLDGSQGYWGASPAEPSGYEGELFVLPDWSDKLAHAFVPVSYTHLERRPGFFTGRQIMCGIGRKVKGFTFFRPDGALSDMDGHAAA